LFGRYKIGDVLKITGPVGLSCSARYEINEKRQYITSGGTDLQGNDLLGFIDGKNSATLEINPTENNLVSSAQLCVGSNWKFIIYEVWRGGGGSENKIYIDSFNLIGGYTTTIIKPTFQPAYFLCDTPVGLDQNSNFYLGCGGESYRSIYKINLNTGLQSLVYELRQ
jgi:hypothetical protein